MTCRYVCVCVYVCVFGVCGFVMYLRVRMCVLVSVFVCVSLCVCLCVCVCVCVYENGIACTRMGLHVRKRAHTHSRTRAYARERETSREGDRDSMPRNTVTASAGLLRLYAKVAAPTRGEKMASVARRRWSLRPSSLSPAASAVNSAISLADRVWRTGARGASSNSPAMSGDTCP